MDRDYRSAGGCEEAFIGNVVEEDLAVEDRLNDDVRICPRVWRLHAARGNVSYQEMFRRVKNNLISQRKVIRASGRDSGDSMKLSRDKVNDISHKLVTALRKSREFRVSSAESPTTFVCNC